MERQYSEAELESIAKRIIDSGKLPGAGRHDPWGEPVGEVIDPKGFDSSYHASTIIICKDIADMLVKHYPGWAWLVQPGEFAQIFNIFCAQCHDQWGYRIRFHDIMNDANRREAVKAGGTILARFGLRPGPLDEHNRTLLSELPRDGHGRLVPHIDDIGTPKQRRSAQIARDLHQGKATVQVVGGERYLKVDHG